MKTFDRIAYRVQNNQGRGPFQPGLTETWLGPRDKAQYEKLMVTREYFELVDKVRSYYRNRPSIYFGCACTCPTQLLVWFRVRELETLAELDFYPVRLDKCAVYPIDRFQCLIARASPLVDGAERISFFTQDQKA